MDFGLKVINNGGSVNISSDYKILVFSERGIFQIVSRYSDGEGYGQVTFTRPVTTVEPPQVFVRTISASHGALSFYTRLLGSSGNWTGFSVTSAVLGSPLQNFTLEYVNCKYSDKRSTDKYGLEVYDYLGNVIYTSSDRAVRYSRFTKSWSYTGPTVAYGVVGVFNSNMTIAADDFISITSIDRGVSWFNSYVDYAGLRIRDGGAPSLKIHINLSATDTNLFQGANSNFSIPICKFPIDRYYNT